MQRSTNDPDVTMGPNRVGVTGHALLSFIHHNIQQIYNTSWQHRRLLYG